ncbi:hypothetical protein MSAN_01158900 [Mycena sanguinolenta]|uniref:DUF6535 domain-containing protein n=1 Tax=Mycena sanguinolenta TaxID=230812 RepID=A0A8H6YN33_9AGAR|nr:hypothetical protein MSAN_01158900 [Mycena sanguinolenta]
MENSSEGPIPVVDTPGDEPCAKIWSVYISEAEKYDKALADSWRGNMNGMLIFAGLFSAILTSFIIQSYQTLQPNVQSLSLACIAQQLANANKSAIPTDPCEQLAIALSASPLSGASPSGAPLACNILWFISLGLSLTSALTATLVDEWARTFIQKTEMLPSPVKRARIFAFLYYGLQRFRMHAVVGLIPFLLHLSLLFFFGGLVAFLIDVNKIVAYVAVALLIIIVVLYSTMTVLPLIDLQCPYRTPASILLWNVRRYFLRQLSPHQPKKEAENDSEKKSPYLSSMVSAMIHEATFRSIPREERDTRALAWTMKSLADDDELEPFVEGIPSAIWGPQGRRRKYDNLIRGLLSNPEVLLGSRIEHLMVSCESGLLEPVVKSRREISCLKAIWCLGMMSEKGKDRDPSQNLDPLAPPPPDPVQPLNFLRGFLSPKSPSTARYLPSIAALADWNNLCSMYGHIRQITISLQSCEAVLTEGRFPDLKNLRLQLEEFLAERRRCKWAYLVPISYREQNLDELSRELEAHAEPLTLKAVSDWIRNVSQIINIIPICFNSVQCRVLLSFLQQCTDLDGAPYEFDLTVQTLQTGLEPVGIPAGLAVATFCENTQKAVQIKSPHITHYDTVIGTLLPWVDKANGMGIRMVEQVNDSGMEYINKRGSNEAICRALRDSNLTRVWERITSRLETCRPDLLGDYSKAIWHLASLFPGLSTPDARLSDWPHFTPSTLSISPTAPYTASVIALLKAHILNAFDKAYQSKELHSHLQALDIQITANERPSASGSLMMEIRRIENDWGLITAICSLFLQFPTMGTRPLQLLQPFPPYTIQTYHAYRDWRMQALDAVKTATELLPRLDKRMEEARLAIATEFMQACSVDIPALPYNAVETFDNLSTNLFVSRPAHRDNQRNFAFAFRSLADTLRSLADTPTISPEPGPHSRILQAAINSPLFNEPGLPWLDDSTALSAFQSAVRTLQERFRPTVAVEDGSPSRRLDDIGNWLDLKLPPAHPLA